MGHIACKVVCLFIILNQIAGILANVHEFLKNTDQQQNHNNYGRKPIVMVPGVLGCQLEVKINRTTSPSLICDKHSDWINLWLNLEYLTPFYIDCWVENIRLKFNNVTGEVQNSTGIKIREVSFGDTVSFEYLDPAEHHGPGSPYFIALVDSLIEIGYTRGKDLRGAPFDWRLAPKSSQITEVFFKRLINLIETTYEENGNQKVVILAHSMGNMFLYYMFKQIPQTWKDKYIDSHISINAPYIGSVKALKAITSGETEGHPFILPKLKLRKAVRTLPSSYLMLPRVGFWPKDKQTILVTYKRNYTVNDYEELLDKLNCPDSECYEHYKASGNDLEDMTVAPGVAVHCIYATGYPTAEALLFDKDLFPDETPVLINGDGDSTVNVWSSSYCLNWRSGQSQPIYDVEMRGNSHVGLLMNSTLHNYVKSVLTKKLHFN